MVALGIYRYIFMSFLYVCRCNTPKKPLCYLVGSRWSGPHKVAQGLRKIVFVCKNVHLSRWVWVRAHMHPVHTRLMLAAWWKKSETSELQLQWSQSSSTVTFQPLTQSTAFQWILKWSKGAVHRYAALHRWQVLIGFISRAERRCAAALYVGNVLHVGVKPERNCGRVSWVTGIALMIYRISRSRVI